MSEYEPRHLALSVAWAQLSPVARARRLVVAKRREAAIERVENRGHAVSERSAIASEVDWATRTTYRRWAAAHKAEGLDGLVDKRIAPQSGVSEEVREAICVLRRADADFPVEKIVEYVREHHGQELSESTIRRILRRAGLNRRRGPKSGTGWQKDVKGRRLEFGGMKLVEAALIETGYSSALATALKEHVALLPVPTVPQEEDTSNRDEYGRFQSGYNDRFRKGPEDLVGPGFESIETKREGTDPTRMQLRSSRLRILERKWVALMTSPLVGGGRWDGMRTRRAEALEELCGFPYMPATLDRFTREAKYAGIANTLWETHARLWLRLTRGWGDPKLVEVLFIDGTTKPVWTSLFSQSNKVTMLGRTMPALDQVAFHSGYGVPLLIATHSGRAPLVREVPAALEEIERTWGEGSVGRIIVIDAEGSSVPFLKSLEASEPHRAWVTRLRANMVASKTIEYSEPLKPYRDGDQVRMGEVELNDKKGEEKKFRVKVVEVHRRNTGNVTYLGASMRLPAEEWGAAEIADLYFLRWPRQEANFKAVNKAAGFKEVHGYGKRMVTNVTVVNETEKLDGKIRRSQSLLGETTAEAAQQEERVRAAEGILAERRDRMGLIQEELDKTVVAGSTVTHQEQELVREQISLAKGVVDGAEQLKTEQTQLESVNAKQEDIKGRLAQQTDRHQQLESRRESFAHDVELDSLFTLAKVGLVLIVEYVIRTCLSGCLRHAFLIDFKQSEAHST